MNKTKTHNIPKLRFTEFSDEWRSKKLGELGKFKGGGTPSKQIDKYWNGNIPWVSSSDISDNNLHKIRINRFVNTISIKESATKIIPKNSILFVSRVGVGKLAICKNDICTSQDFMNYIPSLNLNSFYVGYYFLQKKNILLSFSQGTSIKGFTKSDVESIKLNFPQLPEQQKIASFLTAVDTKITQLTHKKELLAQYKKGVMQQIFNQELRFKDDKGNKYPKWKVKMLGEIGSFQTSSVDKLSKDNEKEVHLVNYMNVYRHEEINNKTIEEFQVVTAKESQIKSSNLLKGDILFTPSSETPTDIGHSVVIFEDINNAVYSYHLMRFRPKIEIDILYSHYFCNTINVLKQLSRFATGSTRFTISVGNFSKVKVKLPCIEEQTKIANFLALIDAKINQVAHQLEKTKSFKKGLLQQLFV